MARTGRNPAIEFRGRSFTYEQLRQEADLCASRFADHGVRRGDRVLMLLNDSPEFVAFFLASAAIGAIAVPVNTFLSADDVGLIVRDCDPKLVVVESELLGRLKSPAAAGRSIINLDSDERPCLTEEKEIAPSPETAGTDEDSPAFILYTSGSTGRPKGVLHRHGAIRATVDTYARTVLRLAEADRVYSAPRMFFAYGLGNSLSFPLAAGGTTILHTERATPAFVSSVLEDQRPTVFFGVPALFGALIQIRGAAGETESQDPRDGPDPGPPASDSGRPEEAGASKPGDPGGGRLLQLDGLRMCVSAGEALPGKIFEDWKRETGLSILDGIGSTEMLHIFISNRADDTRPDCSGRVVDGYEARLLDEAGHDIAEGQTGNLWVRGPSSTGGYWNMPDLSAEVIKGGWVRTGDLYRRDSYGYLYQLGRSDDCFKVKGLWVSPIEVESVLLSHELVTEAAVVPDFDASGLATAHAFVVIREEKDREGVAEALLNYAAARLPGHKVPSQIDFVEALPRTATGKVQRFKLRQQTGTED